MPIISGITAAVAGIFGGGIFATAVANLLVGVAFNALASALSGKPKEGDKPGIVQSMQQGADVPRSFIMGTYATEGSIVYHNTWGKDGKTPNAYYTRVTALSDLPVKGLAEVWIDGERCVLDRANPDPGGKGWPVVQFVEQRSVSRLSVDGTSDTVEAVDEDYNEVLAWVKFYDGTQAAGDGFLTDTVATLERPWSASAVGKGMAYAVVTCLFDRERWRGLPRMKYVVDGIPMLDVSTGNTGTADRLAAVQAYTVLKGISYGGEWFYGPQTTGPGALRAAEWSAAITACRAAVPGGAAMSPARRQAVFGRTTVPPRYRSGMEVSVDREPWEVLGDIATACNGRITNIAGRYRFQTGEAEAASFEFSDGDIVSTEEQTFAPFFPLAKTVNGITATYPEPDEAWEVQDAPPYYRPDIEVEDGNRRLTRNVELRSVPYREQVQRLMRAAFKEARRARRHTIVLPSRFWSVEPGDFGNWALSPRNGYITKLFRADGVADLPNGDIVVDLTEVHPSDYDWSAPDDYVDVIKGSVLRPTSYFVGVPSFDLKPIKLRDGSGAARRPGLFLSWSAARDDTRKIDWQLRVKGTTEIVRKGRIDDISTEGEVIGGGILPSTEYEGRVKYVPQPGRRTAWSGWRSATTFPLRLGADDIDPGAIAFSVSQDILREVDGRLRPLKRAADRQADIAIRELLDRYKADREGADDVARVNTDIRERIKDGEFAEAKSRTDAIAKMGNGLAIASSQLSARVTNNEAKAVVTDVAIAQLQSGESTAVNQLTGRVTVVEGVTTATASDVTTLKSKVNNPTTGLAKTRAELQSLSVTQASDESALSSRIDTVSATAGTANSKASTNTTAISDINGRASGTFVAKVQGGGANARLYMVAADSPATGPISTIGMDADYIFAQGVLGSDTFVSGSSGWRVSRAGAAEFNSVTIRRQLREATGTASLNAFTPDVTGNGNADPDNQAYMKPGFNYFIRETPITIGAWKSQNSTYSASAGWDSGGTITYDSNDDLSDVRFGWVAEILPLTAGTGPQRLRLILRFWSRKVLSVNSGTLRWNIYRNT